MGCDIHNHVEIKQTVNGVQKWVCADYFKINRYFDGVDNEEKEYSLVDFCDGRNYSLFSILANVRNYSNTEFICEPKGIPDDCCEQIKKDFEYWGDDAHSESYFTLEELIEWQKKALPLKHSGFISKEDAELLEKKILPKCWCQGTTDRDWVLRKWEENNDVLNPIIEALIQRGREYNLFFSDEDIKIKSNKIRLVFWFDN